MYRTCVKRCYSEIEFEGPLEETEITWQQWSRVVTSEEEKHFANFAKVTQSGKCEDLLALLNKKLDSLAKHHFNWLHQAKTLRELKETLREDEVCIHVDFSDTMACQFLHQAVNFGRHGLGEFRERHGIYIIRPEDAETCDPPSEVVLIVEGVKVLQNLGDVTKACALPLAVIYSLNLSYPLDLKHTFEFSRKCCWDLMHRNCHAKMQVLNNKHVGGISTS
ncbi:sterile alpha motif domain-containing 3-like protein [Labeo rohita]|uniref:Sterile alpha motif domain-containing 3-like protein n=1 Tax=Labeo rohita TaxID=84645 RepID=A0A498NL89_LABRO|nr:sterile alpha motif domain-containing 3-like protein [Labeo rohita]